MGGGNKTTQSTNQSSKTGPWSPAVPAEKQLLGQIQGISPVDTASLTPNTQSLIQSILSGNPNANPYTNQLLGTIQNSVYNTLGSQFAGAGRNVNSGSFSGVQGSPGYAEAIARGLGQAEAPTLFSNQLSMLGMLPQLAATPYNGVAAQEGLLNQIAGLGSTGKMSGTTTTTLPTNPFQTAIGAGLGIAGLGMTPMGYTSTPLANGGTNVAANTLFGGLLGL